MAQSNVVQLVVDDASPQVLYSPFGDTLSTPNLLAGWNPYYSMSGFPSTPGQVGSGSTSHITSLDGASLSLQWSGTNIKLFGNASHTSYTIKLDGTSRSDISSSPDTNVLASFTDLTDGDHLLSLIHNSPSPSSNTSYISFDRAVMNLPRPTLVQGDISSFQSINEKDISFYGNWSFQLQGEGENSRGFRQSSTGGNIVMAAFQGSAFRLLGMMSPSAATYNVLVQPQSPNSTSPSISRTFSARSSFQHSSALLFFATGLNESEAYSVKVAHMGGGSLAVATNGFEVLGFGIPATSLPSPSPTVSGSLNASSYPPGTIAALALSGIILFLLISLLLFYFLIWRPRGGRRRTPGRPVKPQDRESGDVVVIQRDKYNNSGDDEVDPFPLPPRDPEPDAKPPNTLDTTSFHFTFVPKGRATTDSERTSFYSHALMDVDRVPPHRDTVPRSPSRATSEVPSTSPNRPLATLASDRSPPTPSNRSPEPTSAAQEQPILQPTPVRPLPLPPVPAIRILHDPETRNDHSVAERSQASPLPSLEAITGSRVGPVPEPSSGSSSGELEYLDPAILQGGTGEPSEGVRTPGEVAAAEDPETSQQAMPRNERNSQPSVEGDLGGPPQFLDVRESSPFRVDFPRGSLRPSTAKTRHSGSRVRFQDETTEGSRSSDYYSLVFPLPPIPVTPPILQSPTSPPRRIGRGAITSFLDLTGSPAGSLRTKSSSSSSRHSHPPDPERSRWSSTTASQSIHAGPSNPSDPSRSTGIEDTRWSIPTSSRRFPFRVSFSPPRVQRRGSRNPETREPRPLGPSPLTIPTPSHGLAPSAHPFTFAESAVLPSPTHSIPTTISDLHFRHSISDDVSRIESRRESTGTGAHLPPHPPLPSGFFDIRQGRQQRERTSVSRLNASLAHQPSIVQRVLGLQTPRAESPSQSVARNTSATSGTSVTKPPSLAKRFRS